jgi:hypothetical protein
LSTYSAATVFDFWGVHLLAPDQRPALTAEFIARARKEYDLIVSILLSDEFPGMTASEIRGTFDGIPVVTISNIYFSGLHPDLTYIGGLAQRIVGPLIDYHSRLSLYGFLRGLSLEETRSLFCGETYRAVGYYDEYSASMTELRRRDEGVDVPVSAILEDLIQKAMCFFSVNHPTSAVLGPYCDTIVRFLEEMGLGRHSGMPADSLMCAESLAGNAIFPIYPEVAEHHGMKAFGSYAFKAPGSRINPMDLPTFLAAEFGVFERVGVEALSRTATAREIMARFSEVGSPARR